MLAEMERLGFVPEFMEKYREYFLECDQVKFANVKPDPDRLEAVLPRTKELIQNPRKLRVESSPVTNEDPASPK
jgi:hypothetical protein